MNNFGQALQACIEDETKRDSLRNLPVALVASRETEPLEAADFSRN